MVRFLSEYTSSQEKKNFTSQVYFDKDNNHFVVRCLINGEEEVRYKGFFLTEQQAEDYAENFVQQVF